MNLDLIHCDICGCVLGTSSTDDYYGQSKMIDKHVEWHISLSRSELADVRKV